MSASRRLFFYGTLRHAPLLRIGLGGAEAEARPARLADHAVVWAEGQSFPMIAARSGATSDGIVVSLSEEAADRVDFYEGGFAYDLRPVRVETQDGAVEAVCYFPEPGRWRPGVPWDLTDWQARWAVITCAAAEEAMAEYGRIDAATLARRLPRLRALAWSRALAARSAPSAVRTGPGREAVTAAGQRRSHSGFFALDELTLDHPTFAGGRSGPLRREGFLSGDAAIVLPYDPVRDRVLLIEQFRTGPYLRGDPRPWTLEPVAGLVDAGEAPADTARREALEEAGLRFHGLQHVLSAYPSPGATTEFYHCYVGLCDLPDGLDGPGGNPDEGEDIRPHVLPLDTAVDLIATGEANVLPLAMLLLWTAAQRARLAASLEVDTGVT